MGKSKGAETFPFMHAPCCFSIESVRICEAKVKKMRCFVDKKASREAKVDKKLALGLGVKRKQLKKKKDRVLDAAVESEGAAGHAIAEGIDNPCHFVLDN